MRTAFRIIVTLSVLIRVAGAESSAEYGSRAWQAKDGLPDDRTTSVVQGSDGYLWVSTFGGVARFDGAQFVPLKISLPARTGVVPRSIFAARDGSIWAALEGGFIVRWRDGISKVFGPEQGLGPDIPTGICQDSEGAIHVAYIKSGVVRIDGDRILTIHVPDKNPENLGSYVTSDREGRVWCVLGGHLGELRDGQFQEAAVLSDCRAIAPSTGGGLWIGGIRTLRHWIPGGKMRSFGVLRLPGLVTITSVLEDQESVLLGTTEGVLRIDPESGDSVRIFSEPVKSLLKDRDGNLWAATMARGLQLLRPKMVQTLTFPAKRNRANIESIALDAAGGVWAATEGREIIRILNGTPEFIELRPNYYGEKVTCLAAAPDGSVFIGTRSMGLFRWREGKLESVGQPENLAGIDTLFLDSSGDLWIALKHRVARLHGEEWTEWKLPPETMPCAFAQKSDGEILIGATGAGRLFRVTGAEVQEIRIPVDERTSPIRTVACTDDGSIWLGFDGDGLGRLKDGRFNQARAADGLLDDSVCQILPDALGRLWLGSNRGISRLDPAGFEAFASGRTQRLRVVDFGRDEEALGFQVNRGSQTNCMRAPNGDLWFSARNEVLMVHPTARPENWLAPPVVLESLRVDDRDWPINPSAPGSLHPGHSKLEFLYTALSFASPENVEFRYQLEGVDRGWIDGGGRRRAVYSRLPAGNYRFRVIACNSDGIWNEKGASMAFSVAPFLWQTWWFRALAAVMMGGSVAGLVRLISFRRLRQKLRVFEQRAAVDKERARIARDLHDGLGSHLTEILLLTELELDRPSTPSETEPMQQIAQTARQGIASLEETVWLVNARNDDLPAVINFLAETSAKFLRTAGIRGRFDLPDRPPSRSIPAELRKHLLFAVKEILNNIVRHAEATEVQFSVQVLEERLSIVISDNGKGIAGEARSVCSNGLLNLRQRVHEAGGNTSIESAEGKGTRVSMEFPCGQNSKVFSSLSFAGHERPN